ncbi:MAG: oxidoreductase, zinc-binding dehydrogenase family protein [Marmoricola sp.]|nr:oxidoreductase, zinc-binding dehydrogenase family protein [Marmoricola sp.]
MQALTFEFNLARLAFAKVAGSVTPRGYLSRLGPLRLREVPDARLRGDAWVVVKPRFSGICGSDVKEAFLEGAIDNPIAGLVSFPHVMGHELAGEVVEAGPTAGFVPGDRVVVYPWLTCEARELPLCEACLEGHFPNCWNLTAGPLGAGMHLGTSHEVTGGFAPLVPAHRSMCIRVPDGVGYEHAVLADPVAVAFHAVLKAPPEPGERVLVIGCGALGMSAIQIASRLFEGAEIWAYDRHEYLADTIAGFGAHRYETGSAVELVNAVAEATGARVFTPPRGMPWLQGGFDKIYDTVGSAGSLELAIRIARAHGTIVVPGVSTPKRFEWTPLYMKDLRVIGSNSAGIETFEGRRVHAFAEYLDLVAAGRLDLSSMITHTFPLADYRRAFMTARDKVSARSIKVVFELGES